jgi:hypothetical protein
MFFFVSILLCFGPVWVVNPNRTLRSCCWLRSKDQYQLIPKVELISSAHASFSTGVDPTQLKIFM